jgi:hypothetical protein
MKSSTAIRPVTPAASARRSARPGRLRRELGAIRRRRDELAEHAVDLDGLHRRVGVRLAAGPARDEDGQLGGDRDALLDDAVAAALCERGSRLLRAGDHVHAAAVVAAGAGLEDHRPAGALRERDDVLGRARAGERGHGQPERLQHPAGVELVLREGLGGRRGMQGVAVVLQRGQVRLRDLLVVEGDDVAACRERAQRGEVVRRPRRASAPRRRPRRRRRPPRGRSARRRGRSPPGWVIRASWPAPTMPTACAHRKYSGRLT